MDYEERLTSRPSLPYNSSSSASVPSDSVSNAASIWSLLMSFSAFREWIRIFVLGALLESGRRALLFVWASFVDSFFVTAEFEDKDETFTWVMFWLAKQPRWNQSRHLRVSTSRYGHSGVADQLPGENDQGVNPLRRLAYAPTHNITQHMLYKGSYMRVTRHRSPGDMWNRNGDERLTITLFTKTTGKLDQLLLEAKRAYKKESEGRINIYVSDNCNEWTLAGSRPKRPLSSVVLEPGLKEGLLADAKEFMANEKWYAERGIPWRRGYLLHGTPGSGKTSLIHSLAGELDLDIYVISLSKRGLDDSGLNELVSKLPSRSLALMEEIDAAFFHGVSRNDTMSQLEKSMPGQPPGSNNEVDIGTGSTRSSNSGIGGAVTLSGLLGAIDGVTAQEGRLLFATTNRYSALDSALVRPGRLDVHVRFQNAGRKQVEELFRCFFLPSIPPEVSKSEKRMQDDNDQFSDEGYATLSEDPTDESGDEIKSSNVKPISKLKTFSYEMTSLVIQTSDSYSGSSGPIKLNRKQIDTLAKKFAESIPEKEFSMAAIQGLLMQHKTRPRAVIKQVDGWMDEERKKKKEREGNIDSVAISPEEEIMVKEDHQSLAMTDNHSNDSPRETILTTVWWPIGMT